MFRPLHLVALILFPCAPLALADVVMDLGNERNVVRQVIEGKWTPHPDIPGTSAPPGFAIVFGLDEKAVTAEQLEALAATARHGAGPLVVYAVGRVAIHVEGEVAEEAAFCLTTFDGNPAIALFLSEGEPGDQYWLAMATPAPRDGDSGERRLFLGDPADWLCLRRAE